MNFYKKLIPNQELRVEILQRLAFLPDDLKVKVQYPIKTGHVLHLRNPQRYTEKLQWYKLNYRTSLVTQCSDKYAVREYVESKGLGFLLNELYAVYDNAEDIDFEALPNQYAMKANNAGGFTNRFISDNASVDHESLRKIADSWLKAPRVSIAGEWCYENIEPKVVFERLLPRDSRNDLPDYKFFCFDGKPYFLYTMIDYTDNHANGKMGFYDMEFNRLPFNRMDFAPIEVDPPKPKNFEKMYEYAAILSEGFPHVRVDFYNIDGQIIFGELTFHNASGYTKFEPDSADYLIGDFFELPERTVEA